MVKRFTSLSNQKSLLLCSQKSGPVTHEPDVSTLRHSVLPIRKRLHVPKFMFFSYVRSKIIFVSLHDRPNAYGRISLQIMTALIMQISSSPSYPFLSTPRYIYRLFTKEWCGFKNLLNDYILQLDGAPPPPPHFHKNVRELLKL
jgi:hypothetical protein